MQTSSVVELWLVDIERCAEALQVLEGDTPRLTPDEYERANAISDPRERHQRLVTYTALRILLERISGPSVRGRPFQRSAGGKPRLDPGGAEFSLSHIDGLALIGVSPTLPLGVDLERVRPVRMRAHRLAEISAVGAGLSDKPLPLAAVGADRIFLQAWARLEAFGKASGRGLAQTLADVGVRDRERRRLSLTELEVRARCVAYEAGITVHDVKLSPTLHAAAGVPRGVHAVRARAFPADRARIAHLLAGPG